MGDEKKDDRVGPMERGRKICPGFGGESGEYEMWKKKVWLWYNLEGKKSENPGGEVLLGLGMRVFEKVCHLEIEELERKGREGVEEIFNLLDESFGIGNNKEKFDLLERYLGVKKEKSESMREYVNRYEQLEREIKEKGIGGNLTGDMRCFHLLKSAALEKEGEQLVVAYCGKGAWSFKDFKEGLINVMGGTETVERKEREKIWAVAEERKPRKNSKNEFGQIKKCILCRSEWHLARECPERGKGVRKEKKEEPAWVSIGRGRSMMRAMEEGRREVGVRRAYYEERSEVRGEDRAMGSKGTEREDEHNVYEDMWTIVDTGCEKSIIGEK